jgi:hypothetical protein
MTRDEALEKIRSMLADWDVEYGPEGPYRVAIARLAERVAGADAGAELERTGVPLIALYDAAVQIENFGIAWMNLETWRGLVPHGGGSDARGAAGAYVMVAQDAIRAAMDLVDDYPEDFLRGPVELGAEPN